MPLESQEHASDTLSQLTSHSTTSGESDNRKYAKNYHAMGDERKQEFAALLDRMRHENETLRKPCPVCGNLVKPELLSQHYEAYHPQSAH